jgi:hypothetical protein
LFIGFLITQCWYFSQSEEVSKGAHDTAMVKVRLAVGLNDSTRPQRIAQRAGTPSHSPNGFLLYRQRREQWLNMRAA